MLKIKSVCPYEEWILISDLSGNEKEYDLHSTNNSDLKAFYLDDSYTQKVIVNLKERTLEQVK